MPEALIITHHPPGLADACGHDECQEPRSDDPLGQCCTRSADAWTVASWPRELSVADDFLEQADPSLVHRSGHLLTITVSNGRATYALLERDPDRRVTPAVLVSARLSDV